MPLQDQFILTFLVAAVFSLAIKLYQSLTSKNKEK